MKAVEPYSRADMVLPTERLEKPGFEFREKVNIYDMDLESYVLQSSDFQGAETFPDAG